MAKAQNNKRTSLDGSKAAGLHIRSIHQGGFRRLGRAFTAEGQAFPIDHFTEDELKVLKDERMLVISGCDIDAPAEPTSEGGQQ